MSTTIDRLEVEIESTSSGAAQKIDELAKSLKKLSKNGDVSTAVNNLNDLRKSLHAFSNVPSSASKISALANALKTLKKIGSVNVGLDGVKRSMESLKTLDVSSAAPQIAKIADALTPLNNVKGSGFNAMMNGLKKLDDVVDGLDSSKIDRFVAKIKELDDKLGPVSTKLVAIGNSFKAVNSAASATSGGMSVLGGKVNTTTLNLTSLISVAQSAYAALQPIIRLLTETISQAIEWDGIAARFGRGFGDSAEETYKWVQRLNKEMDINVQQFMQYSSVYATMLTGFGVATKDATQMALGYTELTYDIWAGYNDIYKNFADAAEAVKSAIAGEVEPIRRAGFTIVEATLEQTAANHGLEISLETATEAQKSYLRYLTLVDQAHAQNLVGTYAKEMNTAEGVMRTFAQQLKTLAQTFGSVFLPILVKVMPWLSAFVELLGEAIYRAAAFFGIEIQKVDFTSGLGDVSGVADSATDSLGDTAGAVQDTTEALKDLKNASIGIDELNVISPNSGKSSSGSGGAGAGGGLGAFEGLDVGSLWDDSIFDSIQFEIDEIKNKLSDALADITAVISGFAMAVGTILVVSGANIPMGLALMALGAAGLITTIAQNWNGMSDRLAKTLTVVTSVLGGFLLAVGAILTFSGVNVGLGIALMAAGAVSLATAATINWKFLEGNFSNTLSILTGIVSGGLLAVGALFAFTGAGVGLGIGLMIAGAIGLATAVGLNWDSMTDPMRKAIGTLEMIVGSAMFAFGAILALSGANIPLGLGLMAAGAVSMVAAEQLNWGSLNGTMKEKIATLSALVGGASLGLGAVLAFSGVATGVGIALMAVGAASIIGSAAVNWKSLVEKIKGVLKEIGIAAGAALLALGVLLVCTGVALPAGIALIAVGAASLVSGVALNWGAIVASVKNVLKEIGIIAGAAMLALGVLLVCTGVGIPLGIGLIAAGAASLAAGVALNWDSIKNSVQNVMNKIKDWVSTYGLLALGVILCLTGVGISPGIALIKKGLDKKTASGGTVGDELLKTIKEKWNAVVKWWNSKPALKEVSTTIGSISSKLSSAWNSAKTWWSKKSGMSSYTPSIGSIKDKLVSAWNTAKTWWNKNVKLSIPSLSFKVTYTTKGLNGIQKAIVNALGLNGWPKLSFAANGGIFDAGSLIWAGEAGAEVVANAGGGRTGVMNVEQMQNAVYEGVYAAVMAAMRANSGNGGSQAVNVYLDSRQITSSVEKRQHERGASILGKQVYG